MARRAANGTIEPSTNWREYTFWRLFWLYGDVARARGTSPEAIADQNAWKRLCGLGA